MRSSEDVFQDIENDRALRENEIRLIENIATRTENEAERNMLRRSLILLTYAHLEGSCKFSLSAYASAINGLALPCRDAATALVAASLGRIFAALRDLNIRHPELGRELPDDRELHLLARERAFLESYENVVAQQVAIPDRVIDTRSNLNTGILKRMLYLLGLDYVVADQHKSSIDMLLGVRNAIAHGDILKVPTESEVQNYISSAFEVMRFVQHEIYSALQQQRYRKVPPVYPGSPNAHPPSASAPRDIPLSS